VAVVGDRQCLVDCLLAATGVVVPVAHASRQLCFQQNVKGTDCR
jgi:hypothetical protein